MGMSEAAEKRMVESSATLMEFKDQLEAKLKKAEEEKESEKKKAEECVEEAVKLRAKVSSLESEAGASGGELRVGLAELEEVKGKLASIEVVEKEARERQKNGGR